MIHDPIGFSDHFQIILQKLTIGYGQPRAAAAPAAAAAAAAGCRRRTAV